MPFMKLKTRPVTSSHPPQSRKAARVRSVRCARLVIHSPTPSSSSAAGSSHATWPPISLSNILVQPVTPQPLPPPTLPVSLPVMRPNPL